MTDEETTLEPESTRMQTVSLRVAVADRERIARYAAKLEEERLRRMPLAPEITVGYAARLLVLRGLDAVEQETPKKGKPKR